MKGGGWKDGTLVTAVVLTLWLSAVSPSLSLVPLGSQEARMGTIPSSTASSVSAAWRMLGAIHDGAGPRSRSPLSEAEACGSSTVSCSDVTRSSVGSMRLRGGNGGDAEAALTESEEARERGIPPGGAGEESEVEELKKHLSEVEADPASFVPCTRHACPRFIKADDDVAAGVTLKCKCEEEMTVTDVQSYTFATDGRRVWRRLCPIDLPSLLPLVYSDSEPAFDEVRRAGRGGPPPTPLPPATRNHPLTDPAVQDSEVAEVRGALLPRAAVLPASAWASQKLIPGGKIARMLCADARTGTMSWATHQPVIAPHLAPAAPELENKNEGRTHTATHAGRHTLTLIRAPHGTAHAHHASTPFLSSRAAQARVRTWTASSSPAAASRTRPRTAP